MKKLATLAVLVGALTLGLISGASADYGITEFSAESTNAQAGGHPDVTTNIQFPELRTGPFATIADGHTRKINIGLPPGLLGDPSAVPQCDQAAFVLFECPVESEVGIATTHL